MIHLKRFIMPSLFIFSKFLNGFFAYFIFAWDIWNKSDAVYEAHKKNTHKKTEKYSLQV